MSVDLVVHHQKFHCGEDSCSFGVIFFDGNGISRYQIRQIEYCAALFDKAGRLHHGKQVRKLLTNLFSMEQ